MGPAKEASVEASDGSITGRVLGMADGGLIRLASTVIVVSIWLGFPSFKRAPSLKGDPALRETALREPAPRASALRDSALPIQERARSSSSSAVDHELARKARKLRVGLEQLFPDVGYVNPREYLVLISGFTSWYWEARKLNYDALERLASCSELGTCSNAQKSVVVFASFQFGKSRLARDPPPGIELTLC